MNIKTAAKIIITALFLIMMTALTFSARAVHNASLPQVRAKQLSYEYFPFEYTDENGNIQTGMRSAPAIETSRLESDIYVLYQAEKNGEERDFAMLVSVGTGAEYGGFTEVVSGITPNRKVISGYEGELHDGCEVRVTEE